MNKTSNRFETRPTTLLAAVVLALAGAAHDASAQVTDLASTPVVTATPTPVKPNLMFILDDSGSMGWDFMPDDADFARYRYGFYASQCNGLAYNPNLTGGYLIPVDATGTSMAAGTYTFPTPSAMPTNRGVTSTAPTISTGSITITLDSLSSGDYQVGEPVMIYSSTDQTRWMLGFITALDSSTNKLTVTVESTSGTGTLSSPRVASATSWPFYFTYNTYAGAPAPLSYTYGSSGSITTSDTIYQECNSVVGQANTTRFTRVWVTPSTITNDYRNWYTYHRTRMLTMRTAASHAFKGIDSNYRVGFSTISSKSVDGTKFLDISDFDSTQKTTWYSRLFGSDPGSSTPLRGALSKAGMYYAKKGKQSSGSAQSYDPVQYSCQKNFSILTTDGYWNTNNESSTYGPLKLDGAAVAQQDGSAARPMRDGATSVSQERTSLLQQRTLQLQSATIYLQESTMGLETRTGTSSGRRITWGNWGPATTCTWVTSGSSRRECRYTGTWSSWANVPSCNVAAESTGSSGTWSTARQCRYTTPVWSNATSCTATSPSTGPNYTVASATQCQTVTGSWQTATSKCVVSSAKECQYAAWSGWTTLPASSSCTAVPQSTAPSYDVLTARECQTTTTGGSTDSLADVAMYYYETDLRTPGLSNCTASNGQNVCDNNVAQRGSDDAKHQHMTTFTLGLGVNGTLGYDPNYLGGMSPDYEAIKAGTKNWPNPGDGAGAVNIDDLWHAAVNGRGQYFSASDPAVLSRSLSDTLAAIKALNGTAAAAATSTLQPVPGENNNEFVTSYRTIAWTGDVQSFKVDPYNGSRSTTAEWSAQEVLDKRTAARKIYYLQRTASANTGTLAEFTFDNLNASGLGGNFTNACTKSPALSQCSGSTYDKTGANDGTNLVNWLRGGADARFRARQHVLGDIVGGAPVFVSKPPFLYTENDYQTFVTNKKGRTGVVYVPSNSGMLHAFRASDGVELWAYVPTMVMNKMYRLADNDYANRHEYFVNASPIVGDFWVPSLNEWRTILVGGLGAGGRGYYALDITDPETPQALWEFSNDALGGSNNLGYTFGNPVITKRSDGKWVVMLTSGYNNVSPGNGNGILFVVDARTGQLLKQVSTRIGTADAGSPTAPSGLSRINNWIATPRDNTTLRVYGGDLLGNVWRFDIDGLVEPKSAALRLAQLTYGSTPVPQPITSRPELATVTSNGLNYPVVYVGTGKLLGLSDLTDKSTQSLYAIKDPMTNTELGNLRARSDVVVQTLTIGTDDRKTRSVTNNPVDWSAKTGWRVDFPSSGERVNIDMRLALSSLLVGTNAPSTEVCAGGGGSSYLYEFDFTTGSSMPGANGAAGAWLGDAFAVGVGVLQLYSDAEGKGKGNAITCIQMSDGTRMCNDIKKPPAKPTDGRRTSWRELVN